MGSSTVMSNLWKSLKDLVDSWPVRSLSDLAPMLESSRLSCHFETKLYILSKVRTTGKHLLLYYSSYKVSGIVVLILLYIFIRALFNCIKLLLDCKIFSFTYSLCELNCQNMASCSCSLTCIRCIHRYCIIQS